MAYAFDAAANFAVSSLDTGYSAAATQITIAAGDPNLAQWPDSGTNPYNMAWWDATNYPGGPADDPNREIVRSTAYNSGTRTHTITRAQEGTSAVAHNTAGATYKIALVVTAKLVTDLESAAVDTGSVYGYITDYGAVGDGATDDKAAFDSAAAALTHIVVPSGTYRFASTITYGTGITWEIHQGGVLAPDSGKTVTINGPVIAGNYAIVGGSGTVTLGSRALTTKKKRWENVAQEALYIGERSHFSDSAKPSSGTWVAGDICWNNAPGQQEYLGWICTSGGSPGTWYGFGPIDGDVVVESAEQAVDSASHDLTIAHGLSYTPAMKDISLTCYRSSGSGDPTTSRMAVKSVDGTNITVYVSFPTTEASTNVKISARIRMVTQ